MLILLLSYFLIQTHSAETAPIAPTDIWRRDSPSCNDLNDCRSLSSIIWSCLATIFLCTWVAIHPNIAFEPDEKDISWFRNWLWNPLRPFLTYKLKLFVIALVAPEYILAWAIRQFLRAGQVREQVPGWTRTHGFFMIMGGFHLFRLPAGAGAMSIPFKSRVPSEYLIPYERSPEDEIPVYPLGVLDLPVDILKVITPTDAELKDRGKSDGIAKAIVVVQTIWFVIQCIARGVRNLPLTELEVVALAYAMMNLFIYIFWWNKPRDVECPIRVYKKVGANRPSTLPEIVDRWTKGERIFNACLGMHDGYTKLAQETKVPIFWSDTGSDVESIQEKAFLGPSILGTAFGAIHCIAWNAEFPSHGEFLLWRVSCIAMMAIPLFVTFVCGGLWLDQSSTPGKAKKVTEFIWALFANLLILTSWVYVAARIATMVIAFTTLRSLPLRAFIDVDWMSFVPHIY